MKTLLYLFSIVLVNYLFTIIPSIGAWQPVSLVVGVVFILRDFSQREVGHKVILVMLLGGAISYFMASPFVAVASITAFMISEMVDWMVYTLSKKPLRQRILLSSALSTPVDSAVFLLIIGHFGWITFLIMVVSKMASALVVWRYLPKEKYTHVAYIPKTLIKEE